MDHPRRISLFNQLAKPLQIGKQPLFVAGHGRGGTTWIGNVLAQTPGAIYYHEPCQPKTEWGGSFATWFKYVAAHESSSELQAYLDPVFNGLITERSTRFAQKMSIRRFFPGYQLVIKEVAALMCLEWINTRYNPRMLIITRHPCGVANSEFNKKTPTQQSIDAILGQEKLIADHLLPYVDLIKKAKQPLEVYGVIWGARHRVAFNQIARNPDWHVASYEDLALNPIEAFKSLYKDLGLKWHNNVAKYIANTTSGHEAGTYKIQRDTAKTFNRWRQQLSQKEVDQVRRFVEPFELPIYCNDTGWNLLSN